MTLNIKPTMKCLLTCLLLVGSAAAFSQDGSSSPATSHWRTLILEVLLLLPLAALAWKLKARKDKNKSSSSHDIEEGKCIRMSNGANAQIIRANQRIVLVVHAKNGSASLLDLGAAQDQDASPMTEMPLQQQESVVK